MNATKRMLRFRWWRFSLRSILLLTLALSGVFAYAGACFREYQAEQGVLAKLPSHKLNRVCYDNTGRMLFL